MAFLRTLSLIALVTAYDLLAVLTPMIVPAIASLIGAQVGMVFFRMCPVGVGTVILVLTILISLIVSFMLISRVRRDFERNAEDFRRELMRQKS